MSKRKYGTFIHGIAATEHIDSSGERIEITGIDISSLTKDGTFTWEHKNEHVAQTVGKIFEAKKILKESDCENDNHRYFWDKIKTPFLYVAGELLDAVGHSGAEDVAAMVKYDQQEPLNDEMKKMINFSIEGNRLDKRGSIITKCIARKITITITACNKACGAEELKQEDGEVQDSGFGDHSTAFNFLQKLMSKGEEISSCQIMKGEITCVKKAELGMKSPSAPESAAPKESTTPAPKRTFTPESAPKDMKVGDRISYPKRHKSPKEIYGSSPKTSNWKKKEKKMKVSPKELAEEHETLVDVLESPSHKDDRKEAKKQRKELKEYKEKAKKGKKRQEKGKKRQEKGKKRARKGQEKGSKMEKLFVPTQASAIKSEERHEGVDTQLQQTTNRKRRIKKPVARTGPKRPRVRKPQSQKKRRYRLSDYDSNMRKAITAGCGAGSPSSLTQGSALQKEHWADTSSNATSMPVPKSKKKQSKEKLGKSERYQALKVMSDQAFYSFKKNEELLTFLSDKLPGRNEKEILALAKTIAYIHEKKQELKLKKLIGE